MSMLLFLIVLRFAISSTSVLHEALVVHCDSASFCVDIYDALRKSLCVICVLLVLLSLYVTALKL